MAAMDHGRGDYRLIDESTFDTFCGGCQCRVRINAAI